MVPAVTGSLRDIRLFVAAYEERSFTAAARRENATQSGVSQHIRKLEEGFGVKLFVRHKGQVAPTPAADSYYQRCIDVLRATETAHRTVRSYTAGLDGEVVVGLMPTMTRCVLAPVLAEFVKLHPNTRVRIVEGYSALLTSEARAGALDFAIVPAFTGAAGLASRHFLRTPELLVSSAKSELPHLTPVRLADIEPIKLVVPGVINTRRRTIETYCASNGIMIERMLELDAMFGTLDFIARTDWVAILPGILMAREVARDGPAASDRLFTLSPIVSPSLSLDLVLIEPARRSLSQAAAALLALLEKESVRLNDRWAASEPATMARTRRGAARASRRAMAAR